MLMWHFTLKENGSMIWKPAGLQVFDFEDLRGRSAYTSHFIQVTGLSYPPQLALLGMAGVFVQARIATKTPDSVSAQQKNTK